MKEVPVAKKEKKGDSEYRFAKSMGLGFLMS